MAKAAALILRTLDRHMSNRGALRLMGGASLTLAYALSANVSETVPIVKMTHKPRPFRPSAAKNAESSMSTTAAHSRRRASNSSPGVHRGIACALATARPNWKESSQSSTAPERSQAEVSSSEG